MSRLARIGGEFWRGTTLFRLSSLLYWRVTWRFLLGVSAIPSRAIRALFSLVRSVRPLSSDILCCPRNRLGFWCAGCARACQQTRGTEPSHQLCSAPALSDMLCGRLCLSQGVTDESLCTRPRNDDKILWSGALSIVHTFSTCPVGICTVHEMAVLHGKTL